jgi:4-amino-4-deoxy-L-arabinose transferase-like glycosyltransferase
VLRTEPPEAPSGRTPFERRPSALSPQPSWLITHHPSLLLLLAIACLLCFLGLGSLGLTDRDEGSNAEAAREMVESGDWITPTLNGEPRFAKPAFVYWLMSLAYLAFGVSEWTARLPSAVFGVALILLFYWFLARVRGPAHGFVGAAMLLLNVEVVAISRLALTDSVLIFFTTLALFSFWLGLHGEGRSRHFFWLFYAGMALATLTKGPIGVAVPFLAIVPYLFLSRRWGQFRRRGFPLAGAVLFLALAVPWYAAMFALHGSRYSASAQADTIGRFLSTIGGHGGTALFYVPVLFLGFFPWSGFLPVALWHAFKSRKASGVRREGEPLEDREPSERPVGSGGADALRLTPHASRELELFAAVWLVGVFLFFSASATRLPHYIGPLFPAAAILSASYWMRCLEDPAAPGYRGSLFTILGLGNVLGLLLLLGPFFYDRFLGTIMREFPFAAHVDPGASPLVVGAAVILGSIGMVYFGLSPERRAAAFWVGGATISLVMLIAIQVTLPRFSRYFVSPPQDLAYAAGLNLQPGEPLILYGPPKPSLIFYAKRRVVTIRPGEEEKMRPHLTGTGRTMIVLPARLQPSLPPEASQFPVVLERYGYLLLANEPILKQRESSGVRRKATPR